MHLTNRVKIVTRASITLALVLSLTSCSWISWPWQEKTDPRMEAAHRKLDTISTNTDIVGHQVNSVNKRLSAIEQRLLNMEGQLGSLTLMMEPFSMGAGGVPLYQGMSPESGDTQTVPPPYGEESSPYAQAPPVPAPQPVPELSPAAFRSPEDLYADAYQSYQNRDREKAIRAFQSFLSDYPAHDLADNAQYWIGESYYDGKMYPEAIETFKLVVKNYPDKDKAPAALLKIGYSYLAVDNTEQAAKYLRQVVTDYPFSELVGKARAKLADLQPARGVSDAFPGGSGS